MRKCMIILVIKVTNKLVEIGLMLAMRFVMVMIVLGYIGLDQTIDI